MMHVSVLLEECLDALDIKPNGVYVDCTIGYAGHSSKILEQLDTGMLYGFDQDINAINYSREKLSKISSNFEIIKSNFSNLKEELVKRNITKVDGFLFDLGVSSPQLDDGSRGFSFHQDAKLDMRMNQDDTLSAYDVVNEYSYNDLKRILYEYGDEKYSASIAKNIVKARDKKNIETTFELVDIIKSSMPQKAMRDSHPARKTFQAIRIEVNKELEILSNSITDAIELLNLNGRIAIISFHSKEDKIVKSIFRKNSEINDIVKGFYDIPNEYKPILELINNKPITASGLELEENNRSRSAKLRVVKRIKE